MAGATDGLNRLFSNDSLPARVLRDVGLGLVDRVPALKRLSSAMPRASPGACRSGSGAEPRPAVGFRSRA